MSKAGPGVVREQVAAYSSAWRDGLVGLRERCSGVRGTEPSGMSVAGNVFGVEGLMSVPSGPAGSSTSPAEDVRAAFPDAVVCAAHGALGGGPAGGIGTKAELLNMGPGTSPREVGPECPEDPLGPSDTCARAVCFSASY